MSKKKENHPTTTLRAGLVPKLRFPEFLKDNDWSYSKGDELFEPIVNKNHNSNLPILAITQEQGAIPRDMIDYHVSVTEKSIESYKVVEVGDFIISLRSFQGGIEYSNYKGLCSPAYIILRKKVDLDSDFYRHYFKSFPFICDLNKNLEGIRDGKMISYKQFSEILIPKPKTNEQQKIASCLSSLDELITAERQKLDVLKEHKKGLLQNLFPQLSELGLAGLKDDRINEEENKKILKSPNPKNPNSDNVPKLRFPEFEKDGAWEEKKLGEICELITKGTTPKSFSEKGIRFIKIEAFEGTQIVNEKCVYIEEETHLKELKRSILKEHDILFAIAGATIGKVNIVTKDLLPANTNQALAIVRLNKEENKYFILNILKSEMMQKYIKKSISVGAQPNLNLEQMNNFSFPYPLNPKQQEKIADTLSSIDELITAQSQKLEALQLHKRGLLQGLFPNLNEVTE